MSYNYEERKRELIQRIVYYEEIKIELMRVLIHECRCTAIIDTLSDNFLTIILLTTISDTLIDF